jgi:hypothetical protein
MHRITIEDLSFCVVETANVNQVCGGIGKKVDSRTGKGAWSASADSAYNTAYKTGYSVNKKKGIIDAGVEVTLGYGTAAAIAAAVSDGEQYVSTKANASTLLID